MANPCVAWVVWGHSDLMVMDKLSNIILGKSLRILSKLTVDRSPPPSQGSTLSKVILAKSSQILSKLTVDRTTTQIPPPRINSVKGNPCKVFADPFQVDCRPNHHPGFNTVRGNPCKVFTDPFQVDLIDHPQDQHCQR